MNVDRAIARRPLLGDLKSLEKNVEIGWMGPTRTLR